MVSCGTVRQLDDHHHIYTHLDNYNSLTTQLELDNRHMNHMMYMVYMNMFMQDEDLMYSKLECL